MKTDIVNTKCSLYTTLDVAINGDQSKNWGGFSSLKNQVGNISALLNTASSQVTTNLANNDWLSDDMFTLKKTNLNLYKDNNISV
jgi:hypothetical protein